MKKLLLSFLIILITALTVSCNWLTIQDEDTFDAPIANSMAQITLSIRRYSSETKYITIYRRDISTAAEPEQATLEKIALLFPSAYPSNEANYLFQDSYVISNHKYQYKVRYAEPDGYFYSAWSKTVQTPAGTGYANANILHYNTRNVRFQYSDSDFTMKIVGDIGLPQIQNFATEWHPVMAFETDTVNQVFELSSIANNTIISMPGLLPSEFYNTNVTVTGLIGEKIIYDRSDPNNANPPIQMVLWTLPATFEIQGHARNLIKIKAQTGKTGYDFS